MTAVRRTVLHRMSPALLGGFATIATILIWSGNTIVTKVAADVITPGSIAFYRWLLALMVLAPFVGPGAWKNRHLALQYWKQLLTLAALGMVIYQSLAYKAAETTSAVNMGVILALMPLFSIILASIFAAERLTAMRIFGGLVSLGGLVYLISRGNPEELINGGFHQGDGLMIIAVIANALYGVLVKRWSLPMPLWQQLFWQVAFATLALVPIWLLGPISSITLTNLPLILYAAIPTSLIAPLCWMMGLQKLGPARTALFINVMPVAIAVLAWIFLKEQLTYYHAIGGAVALAGVAIGLNGQGSSVVPVEVSASQAVWETEEL